MQAAAAKNNNTKLTPTVLIVGAGPSGLAAVKEMREAGIEATVVDERAEFGGVFSPNSDVTFDDLHLTISNMFMAFSDFPPKDATPKFWSKAEYYSYLEQYVNHFQLRQYMCLETKVERAELNGLQKWDVITTSSTKKNGVPTPDSTTTTSHTFDYLVVATGANHVPFIPPIFDGFKGEIIHSSQYHSAEQVQGKKVLVVGTGESSSDVASSAAAVAKSVTVWCRRHADLAPRFIRDFIDNPGCDEREKLKHQDNLMPNDFLESNTITPIMRNVPLALYSVGLHGFWRRLKGKHGTTSTQGLVCTFTSNQAWQADFFSSDHATVPTKSSILSTSASRGELDWIVAPTITCGAETGKSITFNDASFHGLQVTEKTQMKLDDVDVIVACTGFRLNFDWLSTTAGPDLNPDVRSWFKHCFPPGMGHNIAFLGFARPHSGGIPQCSEMLARYIALIQTGKLELPTNYAQIAKVEGQCEEECFHQSPNYRLLVDYYAFMMSVARLAGCLPKTPSCFSPTDVIKYWTFPRWPCFFRSQGVGANPAACDAVLDKFGPFDALVPTPLLGLQLLFTFIMPFVNFFSFCLNPVFNIFGRKTLPVGYKWRMSKFHFLYSNSLCLADFKTAIAQFAAGAYLLGHVVVVLCRAIVPCIKKRSTTQADELQNQNGLYAP